jgi:hypothetical protein
MKFTLIWSGSLTVFHNLQHTKKIKPFFSLCAWIYVHFPTDTCILVTIVYENNIGHSTMLNLSSIFLRNAHCQCVTSPSLSSRSCIVKSSSSKEFALFCWCCVHDNPFTSKIAYMSSYHSLPKISCSRSLLEGAPTSSVLERCVTPSGEWEIDSLPRVLSASCVTRPLVREWTS